MIVYHSLTRSYPTLLIEILKIFFIAVCNVDVGREIVFFLPHIERTEVFIYRMMVSMVLN